MRRRKFPICMSLNRFCFCLGTEKDGLRPETDVLMALNYHVWVYGKLQLVGIRRHDLV